MAKKNENKVAVDNKITITRALNELKLLDSRIDKSINQAVFVDYTVNGKNSQKEFTPKEDLQSINDMINRRQKIKSLIMESNAKTEVTIAGQKMKVIEAIETKSSIGYKLKLLGRLKNNLLTVNNIIERTNQNVQERLDNLLISNFGKDKKANEDDFAAVSVPFLKTNEAKLDDKIEIQKEIKALEEFIDTFTSEVDFVLSESNALTTIEI